MNNKLCLSASALILGLLLSGSAFAQATANNGSSAATSGARATTGSQNGNAVGSNNNNSNQGNDQSTTTQDNGNADDSNNDNSNQGNTDNSGQNNSTNVSKENGNTVASNNTRSTDNSNQDNDSSQKNGNTVKSNNAIGNKDNSGQNNSTNDSHNITVGDVAVTVSLQTLTETVTGTRVSAEGARRADGSGVIATGAISLNGAAFAGIQTASSNTGIGNANQAATSLAANANISFGAP